MGGVYPYSLFHDILRGRERGREKERERKGKKGKEREREREGEREEKTGDGFVITESFSYLCMRDRYLDRQTNRTSIVPPAHKN
ncbi:hypothetical protein I6E46_02190 [Prevotella loescheii]|nr:hypothetical protein [Hoylesella loescheii]